MRANFPLLLALLILIPAVSAYNPNYTINLSTSDIARVNQSMVQDPTNGSSIPWDLWVPSGLIGLGLVILALCKPRIQKMDYETDIILSVLAWPFCWYFTWGCLTSVDRIAGVAITSTNGVTVMITQHILYTFGILGAICVCGCIVAGFITAILVSQFNLFKEREEQFKVAQQKQKQEE
jgi:hypothetical protein